MNCKNIITLMLFLMLLNFSNNRTEACTSFAVYSTDTFYGMNLDYPQCELRFSVKQFWGYKMFQLEFNQGGTWLRAVGMNEKGVFANTQMIFPVINATPRQGEESFYIGDIATVALNDFEATQDVVDFLGNNNLRLMQNSAFQFHDLVADPTGTSVVFEVGSNGNKFTYTQNGFNIMTNFNRHQFDGADYNEVTGVGADRYKEAYSYISQHMNDFSLQDGIEVLNRTKQTGGSYPTICSLILDPVALEVYIMIKRNYTQVWRLSIQNGTIETYAGFDSYVSQLLGAEGITATELSSLVTDVEDLGYNSTPTQPFLFNNYPNPFNSQTTISFNLPASQLVELKIFNSVGREITTLVNGTLNAGIHSFNFNAAGLTSGIYFCRMDCKAYRKTIKINYLK